MAFACKTGRNKKEKNKDYYSKFKERKKTLSSSIDSDSLNRTKYA
jgi:hypothetical protein